MEERRTLNDSYAEEIQVYKTKDRSKKSSSKEESRFPKDKVMMNVIVAIGILFIISLFVENANRREKLYFQKGAVVGTEYEVVTSMYLMGYVTEENMYEVEKIYKEVLNNPSKKAITEFEEKVMDVLSNMTYQIPMPIIEL